MRKLSFVFLALTIAGCNGDSDGDPYGDRDVSPGDSASGGDSQGGDSGPPEITLDITATCPTLTPCGGDVVGTWFVTDVCIEESVLYADLFDYCATAVIDNIEAPASGEVTFTAVTVDRYAVAEVTTDILIPIECGGCKCALVEDALVLASLDATCNPDCNASSQCECTIVADLVIDEAGTYTIANNTITTSDGSTFDYCITGNEFEYINTDLVDTEPGLYTMTKQ